MSFFNWWNFSLCSGLLLGVTVVVYVKDHQSWVAADVILTTVVVMSIVIFCVNHKSTLESFGDEMEVVWRRRRSWRRSSLPRILSFPFSDPYSLALHRPASSRLPPSYLTFFKKWVHWVEDRVHVHQFFKVPELNDNFLKNQYYSKVYTYVNSLASIEDSDFTNLFAGKKSNDIVLCLDDNQTVHDEFLGARVSWTNEVGEGIGK
ncbi:hypothetical protein U1Q18_023755, partial [Sarracenia purpurea var. burkii]